MPAGHLCGNGKQKRKGEEENTADRRESLLRPALPNYRVADDHPGCQAAGRFMATGQQIEAEVLCKGIFCGPGRFLPALRSLKDSGGDLLDAAAVDDVAVGGSGGFEFPSKGPRVHAGKTEGGIVTIVPFVIVE